MDLDQLGYFGAARRRMEGFFVFASDGAAFAVWNHLFHDLLPYYVGFDGPGLASSMYRIFGYVRDGVSPAFSSWATANAQASRWGNADDTSSLVLGRRKLYRFGRVASFIFIRLLLPRLSWRLHGALGRWMWPSLANTVIGSALLVLCLWMLPCWETASFDPSISQVFAETISMPAEELWNIRRRVLQLSYLGTVMPVPRYRYSSQLSGRDIRLLKIAVQDNRIFCSFRTTSLDDAPPYMAVSYRWGSPKRTHCLLVSESNSATDIEINENCFKALCRITPQSTTRYVWIDAVCINQDDEEEKFRQILLMGEIYSSAVQVVSVFGKERTPGETQHFIRRLVESEQHQESLKPGEFHPISLAGESYNWSQLLPLASHEYWKRAWIVQEVALSRRLTILYGESEIPWSHIELLLRYFGPGNSRRYSRYFSEVDEIHLTMIGSLNTILPFKVFKGRVTSGSQLRLSQLAMELRRQEASDPRDHLYAFLGLSQDSSHPELKPNPQHTPEEVYTKFMLFTLSQGDLGILEHMTRPENYEDTRNPRLPPWVPNLGTNPGPYHLAEYSVLSSPATRLDYSLSSTLDHAFLLHIRGAIVDELGPHFVLTPPVGTTPRSHILGKKEPDRTYPKLPVPSSSTWEQYGPWPKISPTRIRRVFNEARPSYGR